MSGRPEQARRARSIAAAHAAGVAEGREQIIAAIQKHIDAIDNSGHGIHNSAFDESVCESCLWGHSNFLSEIIAACTAPTGEPA